jgi:hypothetical protein
MGRKVLLLPTARKERTYATVASLVRNARRHNYRKPLHFVVADFTSRNVSSKTKERLKKLERDARKKWGMDNVNIHHYDVWDQKRVFEEMKKDPRFRRLDKYVGPTQEAPGGYGKSRNRTAVLAFRKGLLEKPEDTAILLDDDITAKNLVRRKGNLTNGPAKIYGKEPEGKLSLEDTGSYFHKVDELFDKHPNAKIGVGGSTYDGDVPAKVIVDNMLDSVENFLKETKDVKRPKSKKLGEQTSRAVFGRRFHAPQNVEWALKNLTRKTQQALASKVPFSPHWISKEPGVSNKVQSTIAAHNMYVKPEVLRRFPFLPSYERGEDAMLWRSVLEENPRGVAGITNPVAHIKVGGKRSAVFADVRREYEYDLDKVADDWENRVNRIKRMLGKKDAWWNRDKHSETTQRLRDSIRNVEEQVRALRGTQDKGNEMPVMDRKPMESPEDFRFRRMTELREWRNMSPQQRRQHNLETKYKQSFEGWRKMWENK